MPPVRHVYILVYIFISARHIVYILIHVFTTSLMIYVLIYLFTISLMIYVLTYLFATSQGAADIAFSYLGEALFQDPKHFSALMPIASTMQSFQEYEACLLKYRVLATMRPNLP